MPVVLHTSAVKRWLFKIRHWSIFIFTTSNNIAIGKTHIMKYKILFFRSFWRKRDTELEKSTKIFVESIEWAPPTSNAI